jgi:5'-AMP-activated protein kinase regulatory beta subunit
LPRGVHEYKFVVDGQWVFSKQHLTCNDCSGNINNIIDTRSYPTPDIPRSSKAIKENSSKLNSDPTPRFILESKSYKCLYPSKNDLNVEATLCPENYKNNFSRSAFPNSNIICSTKNEFTNSNQIIFSNENSSIKLLAIPQHVNLNHLCLKSKEDTNSRQVIVTSTTHRVRHKFLTIIYLKPLN